ncbi:MAG: starch-binding protein [Muribaculaceae bacterium]|nr:starch-binding protein [Muribaculaceae bacterium]
MKKFYLTLASALIAISAMAQGWPANYGGIMLQGFYWDSYDYTKWENLTARSEELGAIYDLIWVPNSAMTRGGNKAETMGYMPYCWLRHTTIFGSQSKLTNMIQTYGAMGTGIIEDLILNHKDAKAHVIAPGDTVYMEFLDETSGDYSVTWDNVNFTGIVCNDDQPGGGNYDTGEGFDGARDLDHTNPLVQQNCITYQNFLLNELGYVGFRLDMTKGYAPQYTGKYNSATNPIFSVGEYFDGNTDLLKQWINGTAVNGVIQSGTFDFALKFAINDAFGGGNWSSLDMAGLIADDNYKRYAVTFVDNHDTNEDHNHCGGNIEAANAFILAMPGTPCIFSLHYEQYKEAITNMIKGRRSCGITNESSCTSSQVNGGIIFTTTGSKGQAMVRLGSAASSTPGSGWQLVQNGTNYAFYITEGIDWVNSEKTGKIIGFPVIDKPNGVYANSVTVNIKPSMASTTLVYTTDGTNPTLSSQQITGSTTLTFTESTVLKVGVLMDGEVSGIVTRNYIIGDADPNSITIYVKADTAYLYAWDDGGTPLNGDWPGNELTQKRTIGGVEFLYKTFAKPNPDYKINFLLNDGSGDESKTQDVTSVAGDVFYTFSNHVARDLSNIYLAELYNPFVCIDKPNGNLPANKKVYLNASYDDAKIVYTTDGSTPTASSPQATGKKELSFTTVGQDVTVKAGLLINDQVKNIVTRNYTVVEATGSGGGNTSNNITIYCKATTAPYLYSWEDGGTQHNGDWPGTQMTSSTTIDGEKWWTYTYDVKPINIIFNDGDGHQTGDITGLTSDSYFEYNGISTATDVTPQHVDLTDVDIPSCATWIDGSQFVYFEANNYYEPYTWVWNTGGANFTGGAWPGTALIDVIGVAPSGKNIYRWTTSRQDEPTGIIFSNYGWPQTSDFIFVNGGYYTESGLLGVLEAVSAIPGDVNGDGIVSSVDVTALYNYLLNGDTSAIVNGDQDGDGIITSVDITIIYNILLGN